MKTWEEKEARHKGTQKTYDIWFHKYKKFRTGKFIETKNRLIFA
jgi:hypothetical protein